MAAIVYCHQACCVRIRRPSTCMYSTFVQLVWLICVQSLGGLQILRMGSSCCMCRLPVADIKATSVASSSVRMTTHGTQDALFAAVCFPEAREFTIIVSETAAGSGKWRSLVHLPGSMVEWHSTEAVIAVLSIPTPGRAPPPPKKGKVRFPCDGPDVCGISVHELRVLVL
jgi:hypothetical protein